MAQPADATGAPRKRAAKRRASERARPCFCKPSGDTPPAKKRKSDHTTSQVKVVDSTEVKCPTRATKRRRPSASDDGSSPESGKETFEPAAKRPRLSTVDVATPQVDHTTSEVKVQEISTQVKFPTRATKRRRPSASDDGSSPESGKETLEPPAKRPRLSRLDVAAPQVVFKSKAPSNHQ